ncbi:MAG: AIR synthase-related protein, partial [Chloroflexota bacterium]
VCAGVLVGTPAPLDLDLERRLQTCLREAIGTGLLRSAHDCGDGGAATAGAECALAGNIGAVIDPDHGPAGADRAAEELFGEGAARVIVSVAPDAAADLAVLAGRHGVPLKRLGLVGGDVLTWTNHFRVGLDQLREAWGGALDGLTRS